MIPCTYSSGTLKQNRLRTHRSLINVRSFHPVILLNDRTWEDLQGEISGGVCETLVKRWTLRVRDVEKIIESDGGRVPDTRENREALESVCGRRGVIVNWWGSRSVSSRIIKNEFQVSVTLLKF